ncbi:MAG TPA: flagellar biosynthetic protein FliO [Solirubrobacteraceae bacterium]|jgi:flagellar protein FliO/FliZ
MKSLTFTRGVGLAGALTLTHAAVAFGATSHATTTSTQPVESAKALAQASGENTKLHLSGGSVATHVSSSSGGGASIVRTIVGLFIVIAVIYGIAWIMKQAKKSKTRPTGHGLSQVASLPLGGGRSVAVVRAGREVLVVGVAENGVTPIRSYSEAEAIALGIEVPPEKPESFDQAEKPSDRALDVLRRITARS